MQYTQVERVFMLYGKIFLLCLIHGNWNFVLTFILVGNRRQAALENIPTCQRQVSDKKGASGKKWCAY